MQTKEVWMHAYCRKDCQSIILQGLSPKWRRDMLKIEKETQAILFAAKKFH